MTYFKPRGVPLCFLEEVELEMDEMEALRLVDAQGLEQTEAAQKMEISQSTIQRILAEARSKVAKALIQGKALRIKKSN